MSVNVELFFALVATIGRTVIYDLMTSVCRVLLGQPVANVSFLLLYWMKRHLKMCSCKVPLAAGRMQ